MSVTESIIAEIQAHLRQTRARSGVLPVMRCADGFRMSVQAGEYYRCTPRDDDGPWTHVEIGYPSRVEPLLWEFAESQVNWTDTVYNYVPIEYVAAVIEIHGGLCYDEDRRKR